MKSYPVKFESFQQKIVQMGALEKNSIQTLKILCPVYPIKYKLFISGDIWRAFILIFHSNILVQWRIHDPPPPSRPGGGRAVLTFLSRLPFSLQLFLLFFPQNKGGRAPRAPPLDPPLSLGYKVVSKCFAHLAPVSQQMANAIHRINHYPVDEYRQKSKGARTPILPVPTSPRKTHL